MKSSEKWRHFCKIIFQPLFYRLSASLLAYKWPTFFQSFIYSKTFIELASFLKQNFALLQKTATSDERFATLHKSLPTEKMHTFSWVFVNNQTKYNLYRTTSLYKKRKPFWTVRSPRFFTQKSCQNLQYDWINRKVLTFETRGLPKTQISCPRIRRLRGCMRLSNFAFE